MIRITMALLALGLGGCQWGEMGHLEGNGRALDQRMALAPVSRVTAAFPGLLRVAPGSESALKLSGDENLLPYLEVKQEGEALEIRVKRGTKIEPNTPLELTLTLPTLREVALAGVTQGELGAFEGDRLELSLAGAGDMKTGALHYRELVGNLAGAGSLRLGQGEVERVEYNLAGVGEVSGAGLQAREAEVNIAGAGDVALRASERLDVNIAGAGDVRYTGSPRLTQQIIGQGRLEQVASQ